MRIDIVERAACGEADPQLFDTGLRSPGRAARREARAKEYCNACPVRARCLADQIEFEAEGSDELHGIFGGMTPAEREPIVLRARAARSKVEVAA